MNKEPVSSEKPVDVQKTEPKAQVVEARRPEANKPPGERLENARAKASGVGLLAMKNELAELHAAPAAVQLSKDVKPGPGVGTGVGAGSGSGAGSRRADPVTDHIQRHGRQRRHQHRRVQP